MDDSLPFVMQLGPVIYRSVLAALALPAFYTFYKSRRASPGTRLGTLIVATLMSGWSTGMGYLVMKGMGERWRRQC